MKNKIIKASAIAAASIALVSTSWANTISVELNPTITPTGGGEFDWSYTATFLNSYIQSGESRIVIFDFAGYVPGAELTPTGWTFSTVATGPVPLATAASLSVPSHSDSAALVNLLWDYNGVSGLVPNFTSLEFGARSAYGDMVQNSYGSRDRGTSGSAISNSAAQGPTMVPTVLVPDSGATGAMAGLGLLILGSISRLTRKNRKATHSAIAC